MLSYKKTIIVALLMVSTMGLLSLVSTSEIIRPNKSFDTFPMKIGSWQGTSERFDQKIYDLLGVEDSILATYRHSVENSLVQLYVGFYQSQKEGDLIHSPKNCMPGSGWKITDSRIEQLDAGSFGAVKSVNVTKLILEKGTQKQVVLYWFQSRGRIISSEYMQKIWLVVDSIVRHRTDGSFVRLISPVTVSDDQTVDILKKFASEVFPYLNAYIPS